METTTIGFIGLGLIGGSIAKAIRKFHPDYQIIAYNRTNDTLKDAVFDGIVDIPCSEEDPRFALCDYIFLCATVDYNIKCLPWLKQVIRPNCILTDVGSVKGEIHRKITELDMTYNFIGGHPMAGSEHMGYEYSTDHLIENAYYILTPSENVDLNKIGKYTELVTSIGALPMILTWDEHDFITATISHLPHIVAASLVNVVKKLDSPMEHMKTIAAGGFKDITRIASSSPYMWQQICLENPDYISKVLDEYIRLIVQAKYLVDQKDADGLYDLFSQSKEYRNSFNDAPIGPIKKDFALYCDIIDETGAIATIATILSTHNISIKNMGILHNREFEEGVLKIEFYDDDALKEASEQLEKRNYKIYKR